VKAFIAAALNGPDSLQIEDVPPPPPPGPGQIRVTMRAASVNYRDLLVLSGQVPGKNDPEHAQRTRPISRSGVEPRAMRTDRDGERHA
jgi:NADPH:quinone reductase-like Zn-dependent oxidoreductase